MSGVLKSERVAKGQWQRTLKDALDADTWGQAIEAAEEYRKLSRMLEQQIPDLQLSAEERGLLLKVKHSVDLRCQTLQSVESQDGVVSLSSSSSSSAHPSAHPSQQVKLEDMKLVQSVLQDLFVKQPQPFPLHINSYAAHIDKKDVRPIGDVMVSSDDGHDGAGERGSLLPPPKVQTGLTTISITIDKIGLKDAESYIGAHISVSVADSGGVVLESQDTPKSNNLKPNYVVFGCTVHIQTSLEEMLSRNLCLFFEFKHYKPKKKKISTRCYALMERDEMSKVAAHNGQACLELYKKPTDFSRQSLSLFTIKQLYLHINITFNKH